MLRLRQLLYIEAIVNQKQLCQFPDGFTLQAQAHILPMAVYHLLVDVFVGNIHTAGIADAAVNDCDFSVAAVIEFRIGVTLQLGKRHGIDTKAPQDFIVISRKGHHTADVIVDHPDFHTGSNLFLQNLQNGIPENSLFDDEIIYKNKLLSGF